MKNKKIKNKKEATTGVECQNCKKLTGSNENHPCPYNQDINNDKEDNCNCCEACCQQCANDI
jgi:hypothetical protein